MRPLVSILEKFGGESRINLGLIRFQRALGEVGNPERNVKTIVIAGTNGKGTTTLLTSQALILHGLRVGTFLSPHLQSVRERMQSNLSPIQMDALNDLAIRLEPVGERHALTYFEFLTLIYLVWANKARFDISVLEVGLGGRLDATNVTTPLACVVTNISYDHQKFLGNTLGEILKEKLGILREGTNLYTGITDAVLSQQCHDEAQRVGSKLLFTAEIPHSTIEVTWNNRELLIDGHRFMLKNPSVGTVQNAVTAYALLKGEFPKITTDIIQKAFVACHTPGRFEVINTQPRVLLSGDHNLEGLDCLIRTLEELPPTTLHTVCGFSIDKPYRLMFDRLRERSATIVLTTFQKNPSPLPADYLSMDFCVADPLEAFAMQMERARPSDTVLVTGSLYLVGAIRETLFPFIE